MRHYVPMVDANEWDAFDTRHLYGWKPGVLKWTKRRYNKRERRALNRIDWDA